MNAKKLLRWSGLAALSGGSLFAILDVAFPLLFAGSTTGQAATSPTWLVYFTLGLLTNFLVLVGAIGVYAGQAEQAGQLGLLGFLILLWRANKLPRGGAILLIAGGFLILILKFLPLDFGGALLSGLGLAWLSYGLWQQHGQFY